MWWSTITAKCTSFLRTHGMWFTCSHGMITADHLLFRCPRPHSPRPRSLWIRYFAKDTEETRKFATFVSSFIRHTQHVYIDLSWCTHLLLSTHTTSHRQYLRSEVPALKALTYLRWYHTVLCLVCVCFGRRVCEVAMSSRACSLLRSAQS